MHNAGHRLLIWDLPTRVFHWLLVAAFTAAWVTFDDNRYLDVHVYAGYLFFGLLVFRLVWGMIGSRHARFRSFAYEWPSVWASLRGLLPYAVGTAAKEAHEVLAWTLLVLTTVHVAGVVVESFFHKENLVWAMISGYKDGAAAGGGGSKHGVVAVLILTAACGSGVVYFRGYITQTPERPHLPFVGLTLPDNATWRKECGDCHLAFYPTLLPARSWHKLMSQQNEHFGEDLGLDAATVKEITGFLVAHAAESGLTETAHKMQNPLPRGGTPLRIPETPYWRRKHAEIDARYWQDKKIGKINCGACHLDARQGTFEDSAMRLPPLSPN